jgi:hypothetical protein
MPCRQLAPALQEISRAGLQEKLVLVAVAVTEGQTLAAAAGAAAAAAAAGLAAMGVRGTVTHQVMTMTMQQMHVGGTLLQRHGRSLGLAASGADGGSTRGRLQKHEPQSAAMVVP